MNKQSSAIPPGLAEALASRVPKEVRTISRVLREAGHKCWIVGGCVRDVLLSLTDGKQGHGTGDWDLATSARPEEVIKSFRRVIPTGIEHGTVTIVLSKQHFEVTTLRGEKGHSDGRRPDEVFFVSDLTEDLARRDFTVNAMAFDLEEGTFHDPFSGERDLESGSLRAVGNAQERFGEDGLRVLRCARFCSTLGFSIAQETAQAIRPSLSSFEKVAHERVRDEWMKALKSPQPSLFFQAALCHGLLEVTCPELLHSQGALQSFENTLARIDSAPQDPLFRLALFVALRLPFETSESRCRGANRFCKSLKLSREESTRVETLTQFTQLPLALQDEPRPADARRWLATVGRKAAPDILQFQRAAALAQPEAQKLARAHQLLEQQLGSGCALSVGELALRGNDLIKAGVPKGPLLGQKLRELLDSVLEDPALNNQTALLERAKS